MNGGDVLTLLGGVFIGACWCAALIACAFAVVFLGHLAGFFRARPFDRERDA